MDLTELEQRARALLPKGAYDYIAGGADDELTLAENEAAWSRLRLRPRVLRDVSAVRTEVTLLGASLPNPVLVAPTAYHKVVNPGGEALTAKGAAAAESLYVVSSRASTRPGQVAAAAPDGARWFQVYVWADRAVTADLVSEAAAAGYLALVLTGDTPVLGNRRRDERNAFTLPNDLSSSAVSDPGPEKALENYLGPAQDPGVTFQDVAWLRELSGLPVVVKGVLRGDDAVRCVEAGAAGVAVSNHGGRQLDGAVASADALREVAEAVGDSAEVYVDGGIRRGSDVVKALALGARAVMIGRPVLWGLTAGGADGVRDVLAAIQADLVRAMQLCGAPSLADCSADLLAARIGRSCHGVCEGCDEHHRARA
jgi:4-hydroxymandelate oxidase